MPTAILPAPWRGMDLAKPPDQLPRGFCQSLRNLLPGEEGLVRMRGPIKSDYTVKAASVSGYVDGYIGLGNNVLVNMSSNATLTRIDPTTDSVNNLVFTPRPTLFQWAEISGLSYAPFVGGGTSLIHKWDGTTSVPVSVANSPSAAKGVAAWLNRVFVLGGSVPGTTTPVYTNKLYWSDNEGPTAGTLDNWKDDATGLVNQINLGGDAVYDPGVGLAKVGSWLLILRRNSIQMLVGTSPANFQLRTITQSMGCVNARTIVELDGVVYFLSDSGYVRFDGSSLRTVSRAVNPDLLGRLNSFGTGTGWWSAIWLSRDYILLASQLNPEMLLFHVPTESWSYVTAQTWVAGHVIRAGLYPLGIDDSEIINYLGYLISGPSSYPYEGGVDKITLATGGPYFLIDSGLATKMLSAQFGYNMIVRRVLLNYLWRWNVNPAQLDPNGKAWQFHCYDGAGTVLRSSALPATDNEYTGDAVAVRDRHADDFPMETPDLFIELNMGNPATNQPYYSAASQSVFRAEVRDIAVEFENGQPG